MRRFWAQFTPEQKSAILKDHARKMDPEVRRQAGIKGGATRAVQLKALSYEDQLRQNAESRRVFCERRRAARQRIADSGEKTCESCRCVLPVQYFSPNKGSLVSRPNCKACTSVYMNHGHRLPIVRKSDGTLVLPFHWKGFHGGAAKEIYERYWLARGLIRSEDMPAF